MSLSEYQKESLFSGAGYGVVLLWIGGGVMNCFDSQYGQILWAVPAAIGGVIGMGLLTQIKEDRRYRARAAIEAEET